MSSSCCETQLNQLKLSLSSTSCNLLTLKLGIEVQPLTSKKRGKALAKEKV